MFRTWIDIYGSPDKMLIDNGGEWANKDFIDMCEYLGINIKKTAV